LGNELHDKKRMEGKSSWNSLARDEVDLYRLSCKKDISIKLNGLIRVNSWKMPAKRKVSFGNIFKRF
jgi:hypothetical protein